MKNFNKEMKNLIDEQKKTNDLLTLLINSIEETNRRLIQRQQAPVIDLQNNQRRPIAIIQPTTRRGRITTMVPTLKKKGG